MECYKMRLVTLFCNECDKEAEYLCTSEELEASKTEAGHVMELCKHCSKGPLKFPVGRVQLDPKHGRHFSWQKWSV